MKHLRFFVVLFGMLACMPASRAGGLDLTGYADDTGAISIQHNGNTIDPYFTLQALLLAHEHELDISAYAVKWANWMLARQKPDATFDRFCRNGPVWAACKTADADDSLLALWLKFLETMPAELKRNAKWQKSHAAASASLARLVDPARGIYLVSPVYQHGLFMDNLEVWTYKPAHGGAQNLKHPNFGRAIHKAFWDEAGQRFLVSTQAEQKDTEHAFYPDAVAQIFPLLVTYTPIPGGERAYYREWMNRHRSDWLKQVRHDFAWGLVAVVALRQNDPVSAQCWISRTLPYRHTVHWTVTDEVVLQILRTKLPSGTADEKACQ